MEESKQDDGHSDHDDEGREFIVPVHVQDLELIKRDRLFVVNVTDLSDLSKEEHIRQLKDLQRQIQNDPLGVIETNTFDMLYSFVKALKGMSDEARVVLLLLASSTLDDIVKAIKRGQTETSRQGRSALKTISFVLCQTLMQIRNVQDDEDKDIMQKKDKKTSKSKHINWGKHCETGVIALQNSLCDETLSLWNMSTPEEEFIGLYCTSVFQLLESPGLLRSKLLKSLIYKLIGECLIRAPRVLVTVNTSLLELVYAHEHLAIPIADMIDFLQKKHQTIKIAADLISEISKVRQRDSSRDISGTKNISLFLGHLANLMPSTVLANLSIVLPLLDAESYYLRNSVVSAVTHILMADFKSRDKSVDDENEVETENGPSSIFRPLSRQRRDTLFGVLEDRIHDVNSFARSHVLKSYRDLCEEGAVPLRHIQKLPAIAVERMQDKTSGVRKYSIELMCTLLEHNPFRETLDREYYENQKNILMEQHASKKQEVIQDVEEQLHRRLSGLNVNESRIAGQEEEKELELQKIERLLLFHTQALEFIDILENQAIPLLAQLLGSAAISDVLETIRFFHQAHAFRLRQATRGIRAMLILIWRTDPKIQDLVLTTFQSILFYKPQTDLLVSPNQAAQTLITLLDGCTVSDATCLEHLLGIMKAKDLVPQRVIGALWDLCSEESSCNRIGYAIWLLSMLKAPPRLDLLLNHGLGDRVKQEHNWLCVRATSHMLQSWNLKDKNTTPAGIEPLVVNLQTFLTLMDETNNDWFDAAQQAIEALFHVCQFPEQPCGDVIAAWSTALFPTDEEDHDDAICSASELSKFVFILGHVAIRMAVYVESLASSVKDERNKSQKEKETEKSSSMEEELGVHAEIEAEDEEFLHGLMQHDLVGRNLLGAYGPILIRLVANEDGIFDDALIKETATVALCKFMCISAEFCEKNLPLIFTRLKECQQPSVRSNIVVALGDLSFRFPNLVEPWTSHIYARLRDIDVNVRKNTIMVLTHLILNDMVKVKGQISEIALSLVDEEKRICDLAKLFFHELSKRGNNPIYNMLPDTIGRLSISSTLSKKNFQDITKFLLGFIQKDRQTESLVEKLCQRFPTTAEVNQWRDLAYCLSNLTLNEKALKKLIDLRKYFKTCIVDDTVYESFQQIILKTKKFCKTELKETIDELERIIDAIHSGQSVDDNLIHLPQKNKTPRKSKRDINISEV